jgi:hypothetical protein
VVSSLQVFLTRVLVETDMEHLASRSFPCYLLHADFFLGLFFDPDDGGDVFL